MKKIIAISVVAIALAATTPAQAQMTGMKSFGASAGESNLVQKTGRRARRNGRIAAGVVLGVLGAAAAAHAYDSERRYHRRCNRWRRWCHRGNDRACWKYDNRC